jgi:lipid-binding SYLF domain-containing protein
MQRSARAALQELYRTTPAASAIGDKAAGVLVFPEIIKGGFVVAAQYGNGVLFKRDAVAGYYNTTSASFGFQAGVQKFGYALFFMSEDDIKYLNTSEGWEIGALPSLTIVDTGVARSLSTTTLQKGMYAFFFSQKGLMGGLSLQGTKITRIHPDK